MKKTDFFKMLEKALNEGEISTFVAMFIGSKVKNIDDEDLIGEVYEDALTMGMVVKNQEDLKRYIGAQNVVPFFIQKLGFNPSVEDIKNIYSKIILNKVENTKDIGDLIFNYINKKRVAYPMNRNWGTPIVKVQNIEDWINRLGRIYSDMRKGAQKEESINKYTDDFSSYERGMFEEWMRYYEEDAHKKYSMEKNMKKNAEFSSNQEYLQMLNDALSAKEKQEQKRKRVKERNQEVKNRKRELKGKMLSRLRSLDKLIDNYFLLDDEQYNDDIGSPDQVNQKTESVKNLTKAVTDLKSALQGISTSASYGVDSMYKVAYVAKECGFNDVCDGFKKIAQEFEPQAVEVDKQSVKPSDNLAGMEEEFDHSPPLDVIKEQASPSMVLEKLERLQKFLKERSLARELSEIDIMLGEIDLSAYFPELGECQSKILDALSYSSSKIESAVSKLRAGMNEGSKENEGNEENQGIPTRKPQPIAENVKIVPGEPEGVKR